jgi:hypothetical protein
LTRRREPGIECLHIEGKTGMISMLKPVLTGSIVAGLATIGAPGAAAAENSLPEEVQNTIVDLIGTGVAYGDRCNIEDGIIEVVADHSDLAVEIAGFAGGRLRAVWQIDGDGDCACPAQIATAATIMAPHLALDIKDILDDDFGACEDSIAAALEQTLAELPPAAGRSGVGGPGVPGRDPLEENECQDTPNCIALEPSNSNSASTTGR